VSALDTHNIDSHSPNSENTAVPASSSHSRVSIVFVVFAIVIASADNFADPDLWMHIFVGKLIVGSGHIPSLDLFSYSAAGMPWRNHEWLSQVILALAYENLGVIGLKLLKLICAGVMVFALKRGLEQTHVLTRVHRIILLLTAAAIATQMQFRPQLFTFAMMAIVMATIGSEVYRGKARLWPLIPLFALWANLHGGFVAGIGAMVVAATVLIVQDLRTGEYPSRGLRLGVVAILAALATLLNPFGIEIWSRTFHSVSDPLIRLIINDWISLPGMLANEWHTSKASLLQDVLPLALFAVFVCSIALAPSFDDAPMLAVAALFVCGAFLVARNVALAVIAMAIPAANHLGLAISKRSDNAATELQPPAAIALLICGVVVLVVAGRVFKNRLPSQDRMPAAAVAFMRRQGLNGNILNEYEWGNYLVWHLAPENRVFIDGRAELVYPDSVIRDYARFYYALDGGNELLGKYPHNFVLVKPETGAYRVVSTDRDWKPIYRDSLAVLFAPASSPIAEVRDVSAKGDIGRSYFP
jgi:hypothetical protein